MPGWPAAVAAMRAWCPLSAPGLGQRRVRDLAPPGRSAQCRLRRERCYDRVIGVDLADAGRAAGRAERGEELGVYAPGRWLFPGSGEKLAPPGVRTASAPGQGPIAGREQAERVGDGECAGRVARTQLPEEPVCTFSTVFGTIPSVRAVCRMEDPQARQRRMSSFRAIRSGGSGRRPALVSHRARTAPSSGRMGSSRLRGIPG
jgi:hypothetical protein